MDAELMITSWNPAAETMSGWPAAAALGRHISIIAEADRLEEQRAAFEWARATGGTVTYETVRRRRDGDPFTVDVAVTPMVQDGEVVALVAVARERTVAVEQRGDAGDHRLVELQARNGELARAAARAETEVQDLRRVNERLGRFAHSVSHDLAQPLAALGGYLELLEDGSRGLDERGRELVAKARRSHESLREAIDASLRHAAAERATRRRTRLVDLVDQVAEAIGPTLRAADAAIHVDPAGTVDVEPDAFSAALQNLFVNSSRYRHRDRPLRIAVRHEAVGGVDLVRVVDNGSGFGAGEHQRIFEHGERGAAAAGSGTGAGLAIVRSIVEDLGGRVWAEDTPGGGATIAMALPRDARAGGATRVSG